MISLEESIKRLKLLKMARDKLGAELLQKHNDSFLNWKKECDEAWDKDKKLLPYHVQSYYPTESEIVAKAVELYVATVNAEVNEDEKTEELVEEISPQTIDDFTHDSEVISMETFNRIKNKNKKDPPDV
jgi:hypothetical protein